MNFKDKVVWITGASSGIGEHLAYAFADQGAKLVLSSRKEQELQRVKNNCPKGTEILVLPLDVANFEDIPKKVKQVIEQFSFINILVNNAGISQRELIINTDFKIDQKIMEVNYLGTVALTKAVLPFMLKQQFGHFVVMSSVMGKLGVSHRSAYAASKHALHGYFDSLRAEVVNDNIKVTIICPGYVHTNVTINALKGDGTKNNVMASTTENGLDPGVFARKALRAISNNKEEILIGGKEVMAVYVKRFLPGLFSYFAKKSKPA